MSHSLSHNRAAWILLAAGTAAAAALSVRSRPSPAPTAEAGGVEATTVPVLLPAESLQRFEIQPGFRVELVAAEPMIEAPVTAAFDEHGRLWVAEMRTYMPNIEGTGELEPRNRILILEDTDGDGGMDRSTVFADDLVLPRGVAPCHGGALVIEPPHLLFFEDTDGDGRADRRRQLLDGFGGRENPEHAGNSLVYGIDNWWELSQHNVRVWFNGTEVRTQKTPTVGQWGVTRDDDGRLYYTPNSNPLLADLFPKQYAGREGVKGSVTGIAENIAKDGTTWPAIPTPTVNRGYREGTLRADGTLVSVTSACGPAMFRSAAFGDDFRNDVFICEPAGQLVKRLKVEPKGDSFNAFNADGDTEFLRSTDERFRPVNALVGPDGNLYLLDMYRGLIQHRTYLTPHLREITRLRGMESPINCGRLWRVVREGTEPVTGKMPGACSDEELVEMLDDPRGWWRDTAQRLLVERRSAAAAKALAGTIAENADSGGRITPGQMWTLHGLGMLGPELLAACWRAGDTAVRAAALRIAESGGDAATLAAIIGEAVADDELCVQGALSVGAVEDAADRVGVAAEFYRRHAVKRLVRSALRTSTAGHEFDVLGALMEEPTWPGDGDGRQVVRELCDAVLGSTPENRVRLAEFAGDLALARDARADLVVDRITSRLRVDSQDPEILELSGEPRSWVAAIDEQVPGATAMRRCLDLFKWPGHEPVRAERLVRDLTAAEWDQYLAGKHVFASICAACHQVDGQGSPGVAPTLVKSPIANGPAGRMARVVLHGLEGGYMPSGGSWGVMPPPSIPETSRLAAVMTYVRRSWGNTGDPVTPAFVARVRQQTRDRAKPWTRDELNGVKE
ncbi:MAG: c-type cytochrome [Phycisphaerales bacterium]|nr:c-type cytochrome [Phycisphaerales bacterium]